MGGFLIALETAQREVVHIMDKYKMSQEGREEISALFLKLVTAAHKEKRLARSATVLPSACIVRPVVEGILFEVLNVRIPQRTEQQLQLQISALTETFDRRDQTIAALSAKVEDLQHKLEATGTAHDYILRSYFREVFVLRKQLEASRSARKFIPFGKVKGPAELSSDSASKFETGSTGDTSDTTTTVNAIFDYEAYVRMMKDNFDSWPQKYAELQGFIEKIRKEHDDNIFLLNFRHHTELELKDRDLHVQVQHFVELQRFLRTACPLAVSTTQRDCASFRETLKFLREQIISMRDEAQKNLEEVGRHAMATETRAALVLEFLELCISELSGKIASLIPGAVAASVTKPLWNFFLLSGTDDPQAEPKIFWQKNPLTKNIIQKVKDMLRTLDTVGLLVKSSANGSRRGSRESSKGNSSCESDHEHSGSNRSSSNGSAPPSKKKTKILKRESYVKSSIKVKVAVKETQTESPKPTQPDGTADKQRVIATPNIPLKSGFSISSKIWRRIVFRLRRKRFLATFSKDFPKGVLETLERFAKEEALLTAEIDCCRKAGCSGDQQKECKTVAEITKAEKEYNNSVVDFRTGLRNSSAVKPRFPKRQEGSLPFDRSRPDLTPALGTLVCDSASSKPSPNGNSPPSKSVPPKRASLNLAISPHTTNTDQTGSLPVVLFVSTPISRKAVEIKTSVGHENSRGSEEHEHILRGISPPNIPPRSPTQNEPTNGGLGVKGARVTTRNQSLLVPSPPMEGGPRSKSGAKAQPLPSTTPSSTVGVAMRSPFDSLGGLDCDSLTVKSLMPFPACGHGFVIPTPAISSSADMSERSRQQYVSSRMRKAETPMVPTTGNSSPKPGVTMHVTQK